MCVAAEGKSVPRATGLLLFVPELVAKCKYRPVGFKLSSSGHKRAESREVTKALGRFLSTLTLCAAPFLLQLHILILISVSDLVYAGHSTSQSSVWHRDVAA